MENSALFDDSLLSPITTPSLKCLVEAGNLSEAILFVEKLPFTELADLVLRSGFSVRRLKCSKEFYEHLGKQLVKACRAKKLPIDESTGGIL